MSSAASGSSSPINISNYRQVLSNPDSDHRHVAAVAQLVLGDGRFQEDIRLRGLTPFQKERLTVALKEGSRQGVDLKKYDDVLRRVVGRAPDRSKVLQKEKAVLKNQLTAKADAIHKQVKEMHKNLAGTVNLMKEAAKKQGEVLDVTEMIQKLAKLKLQVNEWAKGGKERATFMTGLDQKKADSANRIVEDLQKSLNSAFQSVLETSSKLQPAVAALARGGKEMVNGSVRSLNDPFVEARQICETASTLNQNIAKAESPPPVSVKRLQKEKAALKQEVNRLADLIHEKYQQLQKPLADLTGNPREFGIYMTPEHIEMFQKYKSALKLVESELEKWGKGGENRQVAMEALDKGGPGLQRVLSLYSDFLNPWADAVNLPKDLWQKLRQNEACEQRIDEIFRLARELKHGPFIALEKQINKATELNQRTEAVLKEKAMELSQKIDAVLRERESESEA